MYHAHHDQADADETYSKEDDPLRAVLVGDPSGYGRFQATLKSSDACGNRRERPVETKLGCYRFE
jgi:hypothetical protein